MFKLIKQTLAGIATIALLQLTIALPAVAQDRTEEYQLKAVLLSRLMSFVTWPDIDEGAPLTFCIVGINPFDEQLDTALNQTNVSVEELGDNLDLIGNCNMLFISESEIRDYEDVLDRLAGQSILTISDVPRFASSGGMINLTFENRRVRFLINKDEADAVNVRLSFQLLSLAEIVRTRADRR